MAAIQHASKAKESPVKHKSGDDAEEFADFSHTEPVKIEKTEENENGEKIEETQKTDKTDGADTDNTIIDTTNNNNTPVKTEKTEANNATITAPKQEVKKRAIKQEIKGEKKEKTLSDKKEAVIDLTHVSIGGRLGTNGQSDVIDLTSGDVAVIDTGYNYDESDEEEGEEDEEDEEEEEEDEEEEGGR
jgi:hypothetical protein